MAKTRKLVREVIDRWVPILGLSDWDITLNFASDNDGEWAARAHTLWQYKRATITANKPRLADYTPEEIEAAMLHELCHVLVAETREWGPEEAHDEATVARLMKHEERVVVSLTDSFLRARKAL